MSIKKIVTFIVAVFLCAQAHAQLHGTTVTGKIVDKTSGLAVELASIQLFTVADSSLVLSTMSDKKGNFQLEKITPGDYILNCTFTGFTKSSPRFSISNQTKYSLGVIEIVTSASTMEEVVVTSKNSLLNTSIDRKIYNVSQDIMAQSGSVSDILKNIPSVEVDIDGQVSLRGSTDVMILINGRPSPLMGRSRAEVLQQLPANSIERIEVITNPSAKYKPDGTSGIINIVLKKNTKGGWNGSVVANAGNNDRYNGGITLNYKPGKLNVFGNYNIRKDRRIRLNNLVREYHDSSGKPESYYLEDGRSASQPLSHIVTFGADYTLDEQNTVGILANYYSRSQVRHDVLKKAFFDLAHVPTSQYNRLRYGPEYEKEKDVTTYWQHNFPKEDQELRVEMNVSASDEAEDNHYTNVYYLPVLPSTFDKTLIQEKDNQQLLTADYTNPLSEDSKIELGYNGSFNQIDMNFYGEYYDTTQDKFVKDVLKSNRFTYSEAVHAGYGTFQQATGLFGYSAGVRIEQVFINGDLVTKDSAFKNNYFKVYPTLHLSYELKKGELQLNYSKRVNRPEGDDLNPFPEYQDPYNLRAGNPELLPEVIHSVEFGFKWRNEKFSFVPSLYYRYKKNGFTTVIIPLNDSVLLTTQQNLSSDRSSGLELIFSANAGNFLTANLSTNFFYNQIDASDLGYTNNKSIVSMNMNFNSTATITKTTMMQLSCTYRSARLTPQGKVFGNFVLNAGARQDLFKKKVSITLTASDILNTLKQKTEINTFYMKQIAVNKRDARIVYLGISYRFGKLIKKQTEEKLQFDNNF